jgi:hypothetical protein
MALSTCNLYLRSLKTLQIFLCYYINLQTALTFLESSCTVGHGNQNVIYCYTVTLWELTCVQHYPHPPNEYCQDRMDCELTPPASFRAPACFVLTKEMLACWQIWPLGHLSVCHLMWNESPVPAQSDKNWKSTKSINNISRTSVHLCLRSFMCMCK